MAMESYRGISKDQGTAESKRVHGFFSFEHKIRVNFFNAIKPEVAQPYSIIQSTSALMKKKKNFFGRNRWF